MMKIYLAPLENITTTEYRDSMRECFGDSIDRYFTPFFMPHMKRSLDEKDRRRLSPSFNELSADDLVPQILTDDADGFWRMAEGMIDYGYEEINLNIGCPAARVSSKGRGAGLLRRKEYLDQFLYDIFDRNGTQKHGIQISVKTRLGMYETDEFYELLEIYNKYPLKELTIHARTGVEKYAGSVHQEYFMYALKHSKNTVCYNGDLRTTEDYERLMMRVRDLFDTEEELEQKMSGVMIGRGLLGNPALAREMKGGPPLRGAEMAFFMDRYRERHRRTKRKNQEQFLLNKSKEIFGFMKVFYPDRQNELKDIFLCQRFKDYLKLEEEFFLSI